jgi:hypothetical protein
MWQYVRHIKIINYYIIMWGGAQPARHRCCKETTAQVVVSFLCPPNKMRVTVVREAAWEATVLLCQTFYTST